MRAVIEVDAASSQRPDIGNERDFVSGFRVTPAYQYDIFIEHPETVTNRATVAQKTGTYKRNGAGYTILTYDTHGTDHKGFRRDEREFARRGRRDGR